MSLEPWKRPMLLSRVDTLDQSAWNFLIVFVKIVVFISCDLSDESLRFKWKTIQMLSDPRFHSICESLPLFALDSVVANTVRYVSSKGFFPAICEDHTLQFSIEQVEIDVSRWRMGDFSFVISSCNWGLAQFICLMMMHRTLESVIATCPITFIQCVWMRSSEGRSRKALDCIG
jgi:hypothetical protein